MRPHPWGGEHGETRAPRQSPQCPTPRSELSQNPLCPSETPAPYTKPTALPALVVTPEQRYNPAHVLLFGVPHLVRQTLYIGNRGTKGD